VKFFLPVQGTGVRKDTTQMDKQKLKRNDMSESAIYPRCSVIMTTYNSPKHLEKVLWGYENQTWKHFSIYIADDGSGVETTELIEKFQARGILQIHRVWHEDDGFRKTEILNKAIKLCVAEYMIFTDGDCIPMPSFVEEHLRAAKKGHFVAATLFRMSAAATACINEEDIVSGRVFSMSWLQRHGQQWSYKLLRLGAGLWIGRWLNKISPTALYWAGCNASAWRTDIVRVNGFDERLKYGGLDKEFGERLMNAGVKPVSHRYTIVCMHLDHGREYVNAAARLRNDEIRREVRNERRVWTNFGLERPPEGQAIKAA